MIKLHFQKCGEFFRIEGRKGIRLMKLLQKLADLFFHCRHHGDYSWPRTVPVKTGNGIRRETYVVCLDCGKKLPYDFSQDSQIIGWP